jgi:septum formation protein
MGALLPESSDLTLWLASKSPRRAELLRQIGLNFRILEGVDIDEGVQPSEAPARYVGRIVHQKRIAAAARLAAQPGATTRDILLVADTTVALGEQILGKPANIDEARDMLRALSDRTHQVMTGIALQQGDRSETLIHVTRVTFRALESDEIRRYTESLEPYDKAGGYGIQGAAAAFVSRIDGTHSSVMGLPLCQTMELLRRFGWHSPT